MLPLLLILLVIVTCEDEKKEKTLDESLSIVGTWNVTSIAQYADSDCSGELDSSMWEMLTSYGIAQTFNFSESGTVELVTSSTASTETESEVLEWTLDSDELCVDGVCVPYSSAVSDSVLIFTLTDDASCEDMEGNILQLNEAECTSLGNDWFPASCMLLTMKKMN